MPEGILFKICSDPTEVMAFVQKTLMVDLNIYIKNQHFLAENAALVAPGMTEEFSE